MSAGTVALEMLEPKFDVKLPARPVVRWLFVFDYYQ